ncbi:DUF4422 domain-containing protein [Butyrivibrio fibrisolvens]|uniref:DUF4422 domain-containing protein n=1 Tax=Butyrivibrio fibrisolvens TaxID=831 RepID=UPI000688AB2A|nr:DUF4422 domain-containing protein [Butyrivibrio fibrisolvens]
MKSKYNFIDRSNGAKQMCMILAGYKEAIWEDVFQRISAAIPSYIDVCVMSSGLYNEELDRISRQNNWSYLYTKKNQISAIQNLAIELHPNAKWIYKIDEDIFITKGFFERLMESWLYVENYTDTCPSVVAPLINVNGFTYIKLLDKCGLRDKFEQKFKEIKYSSGLEHHKWTRDDGDFARFMWGSEAKELSDIDKLTEKFNAEPLSFSYCPGRFSIGAILFHRDFFDEMHGFLVDKGNGLGIDEERICWFAMNNARPIVVNENIVVGHLGFGPQTETMMQYYAKNRDVFREKNTSKAKQKIRVIVSCHKKSVIPMSTIYLPVEVGAANRKEHLVDCQRDDEGKNISKYNYSFSELSAQYWAWKNLDLEYYGQCHYRRYFYFGTEAYRTNDHAQIEESILDAASSKKYLLEERSLINDLSSKYDLIAPLSWDVSMAPTPKGYKKTIKDHMVAYELITERDINCLMELTDQLAPDWSGGLKEYLNGSEYIGYNCFIMKKELFNDFCEKEFSILIKFAERESFEGLEDRLCGYLGEILFSVFVRKCEEDGKRVKRAPLVFFLKTTENKNRDFIEAAQKKYIRFIPPTRKYMNRKFREVREQIDRLGQLVEEKNLEE